MMKNTPSAVALTAFALLSPFLFAEESHEGQNHNDHGETAHDHMKQMEGPNRGRIIVSTEPHAEIFVTEDRKVRVTFLDENFKAITPTEETVSAIGGERSAPTRMIFEKNGDSMLSDKALPEGNMIPLILQIRTGAENDFVTEKFTINLNECPTCDHLEYACICSHTENGHDGHDHN